MLIHALPFWMSITFLPLVLAGAVFGGIWTFITPIYAWIVMSILDRIWGLDTENPDLETDDAALFWHKLITWIWLPLQVFMIYIVVVAISRYDHLALWESGLLIFSLGVISGSIGINYAHELMHQRNRYERWLGEALMTSVLYGHFVSEHLLVHHRYVATPRDPVTARYNESFLRFFPRVLWSCVASAWKAEVALLARKDRPWWHQKNPFWKYWLGGLAFLALAYAIDGWAGVAVYILQAFFAVWMLELVNYVEHYGLTRKHLGDGKYEHVQPRHSWNASHRITNYMLINLQRHSDHHFKPDRRFPLLQTYDEDDAPQLPFSYPIMTAMAMWPPIFRRVMNKRVRDWRGRYYPEIVDWEPYAAGLNPPPR
ncbi:MAG: alkane 1-monooxygenase [Pseudomonadota bacterium]